MEIHRKDLLSLAIFIGTLLVVSFIVGEVALLFDQSLQAAAIGSDYCFQLTSHKQDAARDAAAASHFCEFNATTGELEFNRTAFLNALSHVET